MKMANHIRRFSMPPPGFTVAGNRAPSKAIPAPPQYASPITTLAQIYQTAQRQAAEAVQRRQFDNLLDRLFNS
jgi:hypothetical protein